MSAFNAPIPQSPSDTRPDRSTEPSMEDILASIRRIIADDQSRGVGGSSPLGLRPGLQPGDSALADQAIHEGEAPAVHPQDFHDAFDGEEAILDLEAAQPHLNVPVLRPSFEDVAHASMMDEIASIGAASMARARAAPPVSLRDRPERPLASPADPSDDGLAAGGAHENGSDRTMQSSNAASADEHHAGDGSEPLVSAGAGASVGSSLQALASSVLLQNTDMVEQMTRDMLRPMLKDWLDDNLPTIVERLVRIEIERVARGR